MPRKPANRSRLSAAQRRALLAAKAGKVVRQFQFRSSTLTSPGIGAIALWGIMRDHMIQNGPIDNGRCVMVLTLKGHRELDLILSEAPVIDGRLATVVAGSSRACPLTI
jgi:hypothetical protein